MFKSILAIFSLLIATHALAQDSAQLGKTITQTPVFSKAPHLSYSQVPASYIPQTGQPPAVVCANGGVLSKTLTDTPLCTVVQVSYD